jgi:hypothetical protein
VIFYKFQLPKNEIPNEFNMVIGDWVLELIWDLQFGIWDLKSHLERIAPTPNLSSERQT